MVTFLSLVQGRRVKPKNYDIGIYCFFTKQSTTLRKSTTLRRSTTRRKSTTLRRESRRVYRGFMQVKDNLQQLLTSYSLLGMDVHDPLARRQDGFTKSNVLSRPIRNQLSYHHYGI